MRGFVHVRHGGRVLLSAGAFDRVPDEVARLGCERVLVVAGGSSRLTGKRLVSSLGPRAAGHVDDVAQHVPQVLVASACATARSVSADCLCSIGGGSATGLAKAVAVELDLPVIAVPTTYAGSEATDVYGVTAGSGPLGRKRTTRDSRALPRVVVYDPLLSSGLPPRVTAASGLNALAQAVPALHDPARDPIAVLYSLEAVRVLARALPVAVHDPPDLEARSDLLYAAYLAGSSLAASGTGLHHHLCHVLGGRYGLVHADVHAALLPHTVQRDEEFSATGRALLAEALGVTEAGAGLQGLARRLGLPGGLAGVPAGDLDAVAAESARGLAPGHPRHGDQAWLRALLDDAVAGRPASEHSP